MAGARTRKGKGQGLDDKLKNRDIVAKNMPICRNCKHGKLDELWGDYKCLCFHRRSTYTESHIKCEDFVKK